MRSLSVKEKIRNIQQEIVALEDSINLSFLKDKSLEDATEEDFKRAMLVRRRSTATREEIIALRGRLEEYQEREKAIRDALNGLPNTSSLPNISDLTPLSRHSSETTPFLKKRPPSPTTLNSEVPLSKKLKTATTTTNPTQKKKKKQRCTTCHKLKKGHICLLNGYSWKVLETREGLNGTQNSHLDALKAWEDIHTVLITFTTFSSILSFLHHLTHHRHHTGHLRTSIRISLRHLLNLSH